MENKIKINMETFKFGALTIGHKLTKELMEKSITANAYRKKERNAYYRSTKQELEEGLDSLYKEYRDEFIDLLFQFNELVLANIGKKIIIGMTEKPASEEEAEMLFNKWCVAINNI